MQIGYLFKAYLGLTYLDDNGEQQIITPTQFNEYVTYVSTQFPDGFTIYDTQGGYQFNGQTFQEPGKVIEIIVSNNCPEKSYLKFVAMIRNYSIRFNQSSELYTVTETFFKAQSTSIPVDNCKKINTCCNCC